VTAVPFQGEPGPERFRAVLDSVFATEPYQWVAPSAARQFAADWWQRLLTWLDGVKTDNPLLFRILLILLLLAWAGIFAHAGWVIWHTLRGAARADRPVTLPAAGERHDAGWYVREADRAAAEGRLTQALQLAFVGLALSLEAQGLLHYHPSKTPGECAREARLAAADRERLRELVRGLYSHAFSGQPIGMDDYRRWRDAGAGPWHAPAH
jgi:Domain of unknown function (DUF4129)